MKFTHIHKSLLLASAVAIATVPAAVLPTPVMAQEVVQNLEIEFSDTAPLFTDSFELTLNAEAGVTLHYTLDGSNPDADSTTYSQPLYISSSKSHYIKVVAQATDGTLGEISAQSFTPVNSSITSFKSKLPLVVIDRHDAGTIVDEPKTPSMMNIISAKSGDFTQVMAIPDFSERIGIETRGSTSQKFAKKQFGFEVRDNLDEDKDIEILGMPEESDWILFGASEIDRALGVRNAFMYQLSNDIGRYAPRTKFVEVFVKKYSDGKLDYSDHYRGVYVVIEKIKRSDERVDIKKTKGDKLGGWIVANDRDFEHEGFRTHMGNPRWISEGGDACCDARIVPVYPKASKFYDTAAEPYVKDWINNFEDILYGSNFKNKEAGYNQYIDTGSFVDFHILNTMAMNIDGLRLSTFMHKEKDGEKLNMGPIWDFNIAMDSKDWRDDNPRSWDGAATKPNGDTTRYFKHDFWWRRLFSDPDFTMEWIERWFELRQAEFSDDQLLTLFTDTADQIGSSAANRNYSRWGHKPSNGFDGEVADTKQWLKTRINWIDSQFYGYPELSVDTAGVVTLSHSSSYPIYYTTDGSDPRLEGGQLSDTAIEYNSYNQPILASGTTITARLYNKNSSRKSPYSPKVSFTAKGANAVIAEIPATVLLTDEITLDASASQGEDLSYTWSNGATTASQTLNFEEPGIYEFTVTVVDNQGEIDSATVAVTVVANYLPVADAGADISILVGETAQFDGSNSNDNNDSIVSYEWSNGLSGVTASKLYNTAGSYQVTLTVTDEQGATATDELTVTVSEESFTSQWDSLYFRGTPNGWKTTAMQLVANNTWQIEVTFGDESNPRFKVDVYGDWSKNYGDNGSDGYLDSSGSNIPVSNNSSYRITVNDQTRSYNIEQIGLPNQAPIADAGADITVLVGEQLTLLGTGSNDPDGEIISYQWSNGQEGSMVNTSYDLTGSYELTLTVTDNEGATASDTVTVTVNQNQAPVANAGGDINSVTGLSVVFDGSASNDVDSTNLSYTWNSAAFASDLTGVSPSFNFTSAGSYNVTLTVSDGELSSTDQITVIVADNQAPNALAGGDIATEQGQQVQFSAAMSNDTDGSIVSYSWQSEAFGSALTGVTPVFTFSQVGTYAVTLTVTDNLGATATDNFTVTVTEKSCDYNYSTMYFRGTPNGWGTTEMVKVGGCFWETTQTFGSSNPRFKFDVYANWNRNYGDNNADGYAADRDGSNISAQEGTYIIRFNDNTKQYTMTEVH